MSRKKREGSDSLKTFYRENFPGLRTHHLIPRSRGGPTNYYALFPWAEKNHDAWHQLFLNMTIQEVWERLDEIYSTIYSGSEMIMLFWIEVCDLCKASQKRMAKFEEQKMQKLARPVSAVKLQGLWGDCFNSEKLSDARTLILYMAMFMVFGNKMADLYSIGQKDTESLLTLISDMPDYRHWAVGVCLYHGIDAIVSSINDRDANSS